MKFLLSTLLFLGLSLCGNSQTLNYYFGNLHSHTAYSDGNKDAGTSGVSTPSASYSYAKLSQNFDFMGISEHNHYSSSNNPGMFRSLYAPGLAQAAASNTGTFLCLYGMEWGTSVNGHVIIYGVNQLIGWETSGVPGNTPNYDVYNDKTDYNGLFTKVKNYPNGFCTLAHPGGTDFGNLKNSSYNPIADSAIVGTVFKNGPAFSTATNYLDFAGSGSDYYFEYYREILSKGYHVGITYDQDNHYTNFGRSNAGRLVVITPTLTESNFYAAMKGMHFYASDDWNTRMDMKINTSIMGDSTSGLTHPTINFIHNDPDGELADSIKLWSGVEASGSFPTIIAVAQSINTLLHTDYTIQPGANKYYFIEVVQNDGDRIVSSPIWYRVSNAIGVEEYQKEASTVMFPNPVRSMLYLSTDLKEEYIIEISDVTGKIIYSEKFNTGDVRISTEKFVAGFYTVKISNGKFIQTKKLVIE